MKFQSFGKTCSGRVITSGNGYAVVNSRNPYGSHNLILVDEATGEAQCHGTLAVITAAFEWMPIKAYRKVRGFLVNRGLMLDLVITW